MIDPSRRRRAVALATLMLAVLAAKLWLVARDEVRAVPAGHDQLRYAQMAESLIEGRWLGEYDQFTLLRRPAYPLWIALVAATGVPLRIAAELLLAAAAAMLAATLARRGLAPPLVLLAYVAFVLEPHTFAVNGEVVSESFYGPMLAVLLALLVEASTAARARVAAAWALGAGVPLAGLWHARPEGILGVAVTVVAAALSWACAPRAERPWRVAASRLLVLALPPMAVLGLSSAWIGMVNRARYGVFTVTEMGAPRFVEAQAALLRLDVGPRRRYVAVPEAARRRAYAESPTFALLEPYLEGSPKAPWIEAGCGQAAVCDDYGNGWFVYALRDAAHAAGAYVSAREAEAFYSRIAAELNAACEAGRLRCRPLRPILLAVDPLGTLRALPRSFLRTAALGAQPHYLLSRDAPDTSPAVRAVFDRVANRRAWLTRPEVLRASGWAFGATGAPRAVEWRAADGGLLARADVSLERADVVGYFAGRNVGEVPRVTGYALSAERPVTSAEREGSYLVFLFGDGSEHRVPAKRGACTDPGCTVRYGVDRVDDPALPPAGARFALKTAVDGIYRAALVASAPLSAGLVAWLLARRRRPAPVLSFILLLLAFAVVSRAFLFAYVDAAMFPSAIRYMYPVVPIHVAWVLVLVQAALGDRDGADGREREEA